MLLKCYCFRGFFFVLCTVKHFFCLKVKSICLSTIWLSSLYRDNQRKVVKSSSEGWRLRGWMWKIRWIACLPNGLSVLGVCYAVLKSGCRVCWITKQHPARCLSRWRARGLLNSPLTCSGDFGIVMWCVKCSSVLENKTKQLTKGRQSPANILLWMLTICPSFLFYIFNKWKWFVNIGFFFWTSC